MKKVLIVDDALDSRLALRSMLKNYRLHILEANDGVEGWQTIIKERPDLVLLDLYMPQKDGFEILRDMAKEWIGVPIVVVSGDTQQSTIDSCLSSGAKAFLKKPVNVVEFNDAIKIID
ncbi:twitching motility two-component system response regulator PilH/two-component system, chemotaxis family, response regulator CheY [Saccharicrinis carchari]|uniref:Twitching motility two-component system response regulator PilH/two-component system, chemotaxis family, response regulator CheY n=1 Tax=Saccharicrinis carchari TaxID=1168039 RepID=A0A521BBL0_SACCC|nr:response regulator [Saccharicrinis carchari]SMO44448.1 twitching motility two-component system response regulator PilH/two-component system, chemotaxis family, response regulator CheY [Saccharicrinis carchari]